MQQRVINDKMNRIWIESMMARDVGVS